ncbi:helix-turn-helix transcriptional regulator [Spirosoma sp. 48-14]|uniref:helix-turn-helix domain-containing protein n=1 Tax=Spirosoma sp. 48-14 TaxID=1895854 RepID=UPI000966122A|nr:helix-turn-helix transcriptional regulator [Spirosoma sp. 48-14]OJW75691.1 MAG: hypothetical protein BGO59_08990 [Spirosoma sp. 48-14]
MATSIEHYNTLADRFRQYRKHLGLSQTEFGQRIELDQTAVSAIEKGRQDVTIRTVYKLIELDCNPNWLLLDEGPMQLSKLSSQGASLEVRQVGSKTEYIIRVQS